jgi:hypothetical protein
MSDSVRLLLKLVAACAVLFGLAETLSTVSQVRLCQTISMDGLKRNVCICHMRCFLRSSVTGCIMQAQRALAGGLSKRGLSAPNAPTPAPDPAFQMLDDGLHSALQELVAGGAHAARHQGKRGKKSGGRPGEQRGEFIGGPFAAALTLLRGSAALRVSQGAAAGRPHYSAEDGVWDQAYFDAQVDGLTDRGRPPACCGAVLRARRGRSVPFAPSRGMRSINANRAPVSIDRLVPHLALASAAPTRGAQTRALAADFRHPAEALTRSGSLFTANAGQRFPAFQLALLPCL